MDISPLKPDDSRVQYKTATVRGKTYEYMLGQPQNHPLATIFLIHGFPDIPFGWRAQVPYFMSLGLRVVVPAMPGYAGTDAPQDLRAYTVKSVSSDIKELAAQIVGDGQIFLGGHDWGGAVVWRVAEYYPELIRAVFTVCSPYSPPQKTYYPIETVVANRLPNFAYQLQFKGPEVEERIQGAAKMREFFRGMYAGLGAGNEQGFDVKVGLLFDNLPKLDRPRLLPEPEFEHYVEQYMRQPAPQLRGPLNWYRTRKLNYEDELELTEKNAKIEMPALFIAATRDTALPPAMSAGMEKYFVNLTRGEVKASHWALTQAAPDVNEIIGKWLQELMDGGMKPSL